MEDLRQVIEQIGQWANNNDFVNGVLLVGGATVATLMGGYRLIRGKKKTEKERIKANIDVPAGTYIRFETGEDASEEE